MYDEVVLQDDNHGSVEIITFAACLSGLDARDSRHCVPVSLVGPKCRPS